MAYYRSLTRLCDYPDWAVPEEQVVSIRQTMAALTVGSHYWHGSHTFMGGTFDTHMISALVHASQAVLVSGFEYKSTILEQLSEKPRNLTAIELAGNLTEMGATKPATYWPQYLIEADFPQDYFSQFAAFVATCFALVLPWSLANWTVVSLCNWLVPGEPSAFIVQSYMPELEKAAGHFDLTLAERFDLGLKFLSVVLKIGWAFLWQEEFVPTSFLWHRVPMQIGIRLTPLVYGLGDSMGRFYEQDHAVNNVEREVFPGSDYCRLASPHAFWHEVSANALNGFPYLANHVAKLSKRYLAANKI